MKKRMIHLWGVVVTLLLSLLGVSCSLDEDDAGDGGGIFMYGTPESNYVFKGKVTTEDDKPVSDIKVSIEALYDNDYVFLKKGYTNQDGSYRLDELYTSGAKLALIFDDVDGSANGGEFASDTVMISKEELKKIKDGAGWDTGTFMVVKDVKLKKVQKDSK